MANTDMVEKALQARREYNRQYRQKNKERIAEQQRQYAKQWRKDNPDKVKEYNMRYWMKKALQSETTIESQVMQLHDAGVSLRQIAGKLNVSHMKVKRIIDEFKR